MTHLSTGVPANFSTTPHLNESSTKCSQKDIDWIPTYVLVIAVLGIVFNVFVLMVFCLHKKACTVAEIYLGNLAAADLVLVSCLPFWAVNVIYKFNWPFGSLLCQLVNLGINMNAYCSIYFLVLVSIDRYMALVHPLSLNRFRRPKYAKLGCLLVWGFGLLLGVPVLIFRKVEYRAQINTTICFLNYPNTSVHLLSEGIVSMFSFIIPVSIISFSTFKIIQALSNRSKEGLNIQKKEHKPTTLVLVVLMAFLFCWVPYHLFKIMDWLKTAKILVGCAIISTLQVCNQIFTYLAYFNSVLNPILYVIVGKNFQKRVRELFKQMAIKRTPTVTLNSTRTSTRNTIRTKLTGAF